jgi:transcriptional regulator with XRE-family HTH domain
MRTTVKAKKFVPDILFWIGGNVHARRQKAQMTQAHLAKAADISIRTLHNVENCVPHTNITVETLAALARALDTTPVALLKPGKEYVAV